MNKQLIASSLAGLATGCRSFTGVGALALTAPAKAQHQPDRIVGRRSVQLGAGALAVTEYVMDKLPSAPDRLALPGLSTRLLGGAASGVIIACRPRAEAEAAADLNGQDAVEATRTMRIVLCAGVAVAATVVASWAGLRWRQWAGDRVGSDWGPAVAEDAAAVAFGLVAARIANQK